jgi:hypothetical protein
LGFRDPLWSQGSEASRSISTCFDPKPCAASTGKVAPLRHLSGVHVQASESGSSKLRFNRSAHVQCSANARQVLIYRFIGRFCPVENPVAIPLARDFKADQIGEG